MFCVFATKTAILLEFQTIRMFLLILGAAIINPSTNGAFKSDVLSHLFELSLFGKAPDRSWTGDPVLTKDVLYRLSYRGSTQNEPKVYVSNLNLSSTLLGLWFGLLFKLSPSKHWGYMPKKLSNKFDKTPFPYFKNTFLNIPVFILYLFTLIAYRTLF